MDRRLLTCFAVVCLVVLSGCSVVFDDAGSEPPSLPGQDATSTLAPTTTPGSGQSGTQNADAGETPVPARSSPSTNGGASVSFDATRLEADHVEALRAAGSFTTGSELVIRSESQTRFINGSYAVERGGPSLGVANITYVTDGNVTDYPTTTRYTEGDTTYERQVERTDDGREKSYRKGSEPYEDSDPTPVNTTVAYTLGEIARGVIDASAWNETGTGTYDGASVTRYDTSGDQFAAGPGFGDAAGAATLVIDEDGVVRYVAYRFVTAQNGERTEYVYAASYTAVGDTTVEEPSWTDRT